MEATLRRAHFLTVALVACSGSISGSSSDAGSTGTDGGLGGLMGITVSPADSTVTIEQDTPGIQVFSAEGKFADGHSEDVTKRVSWSVNDLSIGTMTGETFTSSVTRGGLAQVTATAEFVTGSTSLTVVIRKRTNDPSSTGLPANPGSLFTGPAAPAARNPDLVYPSDGVLVPPNLGQLEFHFMPGTVNSLFGLSFANAITDVKVYLKCTMPLNGGCIYKPDPSVWTWIARTNSGNGPLAYSIKGTDDGSLVGTSAGQSLSFASEDVGGAIYYWTTSGTSAIVRFDFAGTTDTGQPFITGNGKSGDPDECIGCHSLSRDGKKMTAERGFSFASQIFLYNVATKTAIAAPDTTQRSWFESWNPDGSQYVGVCGAGTPSGCPNPNLLLIDGSNGTLASVIDVGAKAGVDPVDHPDWSADGNAIVYMRPGLPPSTLQTPMNGAIEMVTRANGAWSAPTTVVARAAGKNHYYPAFSPDNALIVYDESTCPTGTNSDHNCDADSDPSAKLSIIKAAAGGTSIALASANAGGKRDGATTDLANSFPKWSPFLYHNKRAGRLFWLTFSSTRNYGLRPPPVPFDTSHNPKGSLIWMTAIDPDAALSGTDPSFPAFALPFQDTQTSNHIAQWTRTTMVIP
jgi:hypothetical protein